MNFIRRILHRFRKPPGIPLGVQVPGDPAEHAVDFAQRWADWLDQYAAERMDELGVPSERIGSSDHRHGIAWCAFNPHEREGGGVSPGGRINLDSGMLNPDLMAPWGREADAAWKGASWRTRMDCGIAHEYEEGNGYSHEEAIERAPDTVLPISSQARELARTIRDVSRRRKR